MRAARRETAARRRAAERRAAERAAAERRGVREALERRAAGRREQNAYLRDPRAGPPPARTAFLTRGARPLVPTRGAPPGRDGPSPRGGSAGPAARRHPPREAGLRAFIKQRRAEAEAGGAAPAGPAPEKGAGCAGGGAGVVWAGKWREARENADLDLEKLLEEQCSAGGGGAPPDGSRYGAPTPPGSEARARTAGAAGARGKPAGQPAPGGMERRAAAPAEPGPPPVLRLEEPCGLRRGCLSTARHRARPVDILRDSLEAGTVSPAPLASPGAPAAPGPKMAWWCTGTAEVDSAAWDSPSAGRAPPGGRCLPAPGGEAPLSKAESRNKIKKRPPGAAGGGPHLQGEAAPTADQGDPADMSLADIVSRKECRSPGGALSPPAKRRSQVQAPSPKKPHAGKPGLELWVPSSPPAGRGGAAVAAVVGPLSSPQKQGAGSVVPLQKMQANPSIALAAAGRRRARPVTEQGTRQGAPLPPVPGAKPRAFSAVPSSRRPVRPEAPLTCEGSYVNAQKERERRGQMFQSEASEAAVARRKRREEKLRGIQGYTESFLDAPGHAAAAPGPWAASPGTQEQDILESLRRLDSFLARKQLPAPEKPQPAAPPLTNSMEQKMLQSSLMRLDARLVQLAPQRGAGFARGPENFGPLAGHDPRPKPGRVLVCATNTHVADQRAHQRYKDDLRPAQGGLVERRPPPAQRAPYRAALGHAGGAAASQKGPGPLARPRCAPEARQAPQVLTRPPHAPKAPLRAAPGQPNVPLPPHGRGGIQHQEQRTAAGLHCGDSGGRILVSSAMDWGC